MDLAYARRDSKKGNHSRYPRVGYSTLSSDKSYPNQEHRQPKSASSPSIPEGNTSNASFSRVHKLFKSLGFDSFYLLSDDAKGCSVERKKIFLLKDIRSACYLSLLHVVPLTAAIILSSLNLKGFYIGKELQGPVGQDDLRFLGLQLAAKLLELLAVASLSTIMLTLVRNQLISNSLPFGALTAGYEFNKLSLLWSKGFVATCTAKFASARQKTLLITAVIVFTILSTTIGPSAAVTALPVLRNWPAGGTELWLNATYQELWPSKLNEVAISDIPCSSSQGVSCFPDSYDALADGLFSLWPPSPYSSLDGGTLSKVLPEKALVGARQSVHTMDVRFKGPFVYQPELTTATTPLAAIADATSHLEKYWFIANAIQCRARKARFCNYKDLFCSIKAMQPVTYVRCSASDINSTAQFPRLDQAAGRYPLVDYEGHAIGSQQWFDQSTKNGSNPNLSWVDLPEAQFGKASIGALVALPGSRTANNPNQTLSCTVDARWAYANATVSFLGGPDVVSGTPDGWFEGGRLRKGSNGHPMWSQIKITPEWANVMNPNVPGSHPSVFEMLCNSVGRLNSISMAPSPVNAVESILAVMITHSLARTGSLTTILGSLKDVQKEDWVKEMLPEGAVFGLGGSAFNYSHMAGDNVIKLEMISTVLGYGYGITSARLLAIIVLFIYSLIAIMYVVYSTCYTKTTSSAWESITEFIAVAVNSRPSSVLGNTGAGIGTLGVLKQPVKIGVRDGNLQMVFRDGTNIDKVLQNEYYG